MHTHADTNLILMSRIALFGLALLLASTAAAQHTHNHPHPHMPDRLVDFPDVPGFQTLACDLHMHTVFSDGSVWPDIRVEEALRDGLDCIAVTDHIEYQPHAEDIPHPDRNRSYDLAVGYAEGDDLIVIRGAEVTREMPPGHSNAIFIRDANRLIIDDAMGAFREAADQGAFTFWNHPAWTAQKPDGMAALTEFHRQLIDEGLLDGIEVVNMHTYSDEALQIALDNNLAILGTSDIHGLVDWEFDVPEGGHRPVTLVFAPNRSVDGVRQALEDRRTTVWHDNTLIGREQHVLPLIEASLRVAAAEYVDDSSILEVAVQNVSDAAFLLANRSNYTFHDAADIITIAPRGTTVLEVKPGERVPQLDLVFEVLNAVTSPGQHPEITLQVAAN